MRLSTVAALAALIAGPAYANDGPTEPGTVDGVEQAPLDQLVSSPRGIQISSEDGKSTIALAYGWESTAREALDTGVLTTFSIEARAPLETDDAGQSKASLDALVGATTLTFKLTKTAFSAVPNPDRESMLSVCNEAASLAGIAPPTNGNCKLSWVMATAPDADKDRLTKDFERLIVGDSPVASIWGVSGRAGSDSFDYIEPGTLAQRSIDKAGWSVKAFYAFIPLHNRTWLVTADFEHQDAYEAQKEGTVCPVGGGACLTGPVGAPKRVQKDILSIDTRREFSSFAASATLRYDTVSDVYAIEAPVYFARDKDGLLNGGVRFGWRSDDGEVSAAVFLGRTFSMGR